MEICYVFRRINNKMDNKVKKLIAEVDSTQNQMPFLCRVGKDCLPEVQLSVFVQLIQIVYKYMHPIVPGKCLSNKNVKNGHLKPIKGSIQNVGFTPPGWDMI